MRRLLGLSLALASCASPVRPTLAPPTTGPPEPVLRPGQTEVTGTLATLAADGAVAPPIPAPFTVTVPVRGEGGARITDALAGGRRVAVVWDGGRPLPVAGDGALDLAPARVEVTPTVVRWLLDGAPRGLAPGHYRLGAPVAVGVSGLARPADGFSFEADERTALATRGGARVELPPHALELEGPGSVQLGGQLRVRTAQGARPATLLRFGEGAFKVTLTPVEGGYRVAGLFQGPLEG